MRVCLLGVLALLLALAAPAGAASLSSAAAAFASLEGAAPLDFSEEDTASDGFSTAGGGFAPLGNESFISGGGFARYGLARASSLVRLVYDDVGSGSAEGHGRGAFEDVITFHDPAGEGSFRAAFRLDAAAFRAELGSPGDGVTGAAASFELIVEIGDVVLAWEGREAADAEGQTSLRRSLLRVDGAEVPGGLPDDILNAGEFVTPEIFYTDGEPLPLRVSLRVGTGAEVDPGGRVEALSASGLVGGFRWGGLRELSADASLWSMSGTDWSEPFSVPEPAVRLLTGPLVGWLLRPRRRPAA